MISTEKVTAQAPSGREIAPAPAQPSIRSLSERLMEWPRPAWLFLLLVALCYANTLVTQAQIWLKSDSESHGVFIFPVAAGMLWLQQDALRQSVRRPSAWGVPLLALGLLLKLGADVMQLRYIALWSLVPTLAGGVWLLGGRDFWRLTRFPICFLLFAGSVPNSIIYPLTVWVQGVSTAGAADLMSFLGYPLIRHGNLIEAPGISLEVAEVCSGFHKMISLLAFSAIYIYVFRFPAWAKALLLAATVPIAVLANVLRIGGLLAIYSAWGHEAFHVAHEYADLVAVVLALGLFALLGKSVGCKTIRFSRLSGA